MESNHLRINLFHLIRRRTLVFGVTLLLTGIAAAAYLYLTPPIYRSETIIKKPVEKEGTTQISLLGNDRSAATEQLRNVNLLSSALEQDKELLTGYYITTDFRTEQTAYRFPYHIQFRITGNSAFAQQHYSIESVNDQVYQLTSSTGTIQGNFGTEVTDRNLTINITKKSVSVPVDRHFVSPPIYSFTIESARALAQRLITEKRIETSDNNGLITIACTAPHPDLAHRLTRAIVQQYITGFATDPTSESIPTYIKHLDEKINYVATQMGETEQTIATYKKDHHITDITLDTETSLTVYRELLMQKTQLEMKMAALDNLSNYLRKFRDENNAQVEYGTIEDSEFTADLNRLNAIYNNNEQGSKHKEVETLKSTIAERILNTRKKTAIQIEGLTLAIQNNQRSLAAIPGKATALETLGRKLELDKKVYDLLSHKRAQAIVDFQVTPLTGQIIKDAGIPTAPVSPTLWIVTLIALITGIITAWPIAYTLEKRNKSRISSQLSMPVTVPMLGSINAHNSSSASILSAFNALCTRILMMRDIKIITVTSAGNQCGKTSTVIGLAKTFAAMGKKVLVLDMNLKNPKVATELKSAPDSTVAQIIEGTASVEQAITHTEYPHLDLLTAGDLPMGINSWLSFSRKEGINQQLQSQYDYILIDTPGTIGKVDALPFIRTSNITLFVMRQGASKQESLGMIGELSRTLQTDSIYGVINNYSKGVKNQSDNVESENRDTKTSRQPLLRRVALWSY